MSGIIKSLVFLLFLIFGYNTEITGNSRKILENPNVPIKSEIIPDKSEEEFRPREFDNDGASSSFYAGYGSSYGSYPSYGISDFDKPPTGYYGGTYESEKIKKPISSYYSYGYQPGGIKINECQNQMMSSVVGDILQFGDVGKFGFLKAIIGAFATAILIKIPLILAIKSLLFKLIIIPIGLVVFTLPFTIPIALLFYPVWTRIKEFFTGTTTAAPTVVMMVPANNTNAQKPAGRSFDNIQDLFFTVIESDRCLERIACQLGSRDSDSIYQKPISWFLKFLQSTNAVKHNVEIRSRLKRYKEAYVRGTELRRNEKRKDELSEEKIDDLCNNESYKCDIDKITSNMNFI